MKPEIASSGRLPAGATHQNADPQRRKYNHATLRSAQLPGFRPDGSASAVANATAPLHQLVRQKNPDEDQRVTPRSAAAVTSMPIPSPGKAMTINTLFDAGAGTFRENRLNSIHGNVPGPFSPCWECDTRFVEAMKVR